MFRAKTHNDPSKQKCGILPHWKSSRQQSYIIPKHGPIFMKMLLHSSQREIAGATGRYLLQALMEPGRWQPDKILFTITATISLPPFTPSSPLSLFISSLSLFFFSPFPFSSLFFTFFNFTNLHINSYLSLIYYSYIITNIPISITIGTRSLFYE